MSKTLRLTLSLVGCLATLTLLAGAEGCPEIVIGGGDGNGGDGDGDEEPVGDGDGDVACERDIDCADGQLCARPDCAAVCEQNADGLCDPGECGPGRCYDITGDPCAAVDCAPGYACFVETVCWEGDCDANRYPGCTGGCDEEPVCLPEGEPPGECFDDFDCGPGFHCEYLGRPEPGAPCLDENGDGLCDDDTGADRLAPGRCVEDGNPWSCANIDCGPGFHCDTEYYCYEECDADGNCRGECFEEPVCLPDGEPIVCYDDSMCPDGWYCEYYGAGEAPCFDADGDGLCDEDAGLMAPEGYCFPGQPSGCGQIDCGPGYACQEVPECWEECWTDPDVPPPDDPNQPDPAPPCETVCETYPTCVPAGNNDCWDLPVEECGQVPGCHVEDLYPPCDPGGAPVPCQDANNDGICDDTMDPPQCDPIPTCVPDGPVGGTCAGHCGGAGSDGSCFCDDACMQFGDCCDDFVDTCQEVVPTRCETSADCGQGESCELREMCFDDLGNGVECYFEGFCVPVVSPDPCSNLPLELCPEVVGCHIEELYPPCPPPDPNNPDNTMCEPIQLCVADGGGTPPPEPVNQCMSDADCDGGACITETFCYDWCDQAVEDPACCVTESRCENSGAVGDCPQVQTPAHNPNTGSCVIFPSPCDVPPGWQEGC